MVDNPEETDNYGFPLLSFTEDEGFEGVWHSMYDDGYDTDNDGLIEPLDEILDDIASDASTGWETTTDWDGNELIAEDSNGNEFRFTSEE